jgi:hypothetical protein
MPHRRRTPSPFTVEIKRGSRQMTHSVTPISLPVRDSRSLADAVFGLRSKPLFPAEASESNAITVTTAATGDASQRPATRILPDLRAMHDDKPRHQHDDGKPSERESATGDEITVIERATGEESGSAEPIQPVEAGAHIATEHHEPDSRNARTRGSGALRVEQRRAKRAAVRKAKRMGLAELPLPAGQRWRKRRLPPRCW